MKTTKGKPYRLGWSFISLLITGLLLTNTLVRAQQSTVVIAEVMYDHPLYDNEKTVTGSEGEFMSLYNYGEEDVDISGWRITVYPEVEPPRLLYRYTFPSNTVIPESGLVVIASRKVGSLFDIGVFYKQELSDSSGIILLYTNKLAYPDTRSRIKVYDTLNRLQDELVYDGMSAAAADSPLLRAENAVNPKRAITSTVSIQREKIIVEERIRSISRNDYFPPSSQNIVQLFNYLPEDYSETPPPSIMGAQAPENLTLTGTVTGNNDKKAQGTIESTQVINSGKTTYFAGEGITLGPGFAVKAGAEFYADVDWDSFHSAKIMTYNLGTNTKKYSKHAQIIKDVNPDVVAVQEVRRIANFRKLRKESGYSGEMCVTEFYGIPLGPDDEGIGYKYGIGMLWKTSTVGSPLKLVEKRMKTYKNDGDDDKKRAFIVAEFKNFCFVSTHYSKGQRLRDTMTQRILSNSLVLDCKSTGKPVYIAGDMNEKPHNGKALRVFIENKFLILNDTTHITTKIDDEYKVKYADSTLQGGSMIDLILEYNMNPNHETKERGVPIPPDQREQFFNDKVSDHLPYSVKVKIK